MVFTAIEEVEGRFYYQFRSSVGDMVVWNNTKIKACGGTSHSNQANQHYFQKYKGGTRYNHGKPTTKYTIRTWHPQKR